MTIALDCAYKLVPHGVDLEHEVENYLRACGTSLL